MSIKIAYHKFFSVEVKEQGTDKAITSLRFTPTAECRQKLMDYKLAFKAHKTGFNVFYKKYPNAKEPLVNEISSRIKFSFMVKLLDKSFFSSYEPDNGSLPQMYLDNLTPSGAISNAMAGNLTAGSFFSDSDVAKIYPQAFKKKTDVSLANPQTAWRIKDKFGTNDTIKSVPIEKSDEVDFVYIRMNDPLLDESSYIEESGVYLLEPDAGTEPQTTIYLSDQIVRTSSNGVLDIYWQNSQENAPADTGKEYQIIFKKI